MCNADSRQWSCFEKLFLKNNVCEPVTAAFLYRFGTGADGSPEAEAYAINDLSEQQQQQYYGATSKYARAVDSYRSTAGRLLRRAALCSVLLAASAFACSEDAETADQSGVALQHASTAVRCFGIVVSVRVPPELSSRMNIYCSVDGAVPQSTGPGA